MDIQQLAQHKSAFFHTGDIQKFPEERLFDASSGISLRKDSSKESLKGKGCPCLQDIPFDINTLSPQDWLFWQCWQWWHQRTQEHSVLLRKRKEKGPLSITWPHTATKHHSFPSQPIEFCPVLWIALWRCVTLVSFWISKGTWVEFILSGYGTHWMPGKMNFTQIAFLTSTFSPYFPSHPKRALNSSTLLSAIPYITFDKLVLHVLFRQWEPSPIRGTISDLYHSPFATLGTSFSFHSSFHRPPAHSPLQTPWQQQQLFTQEINSRKGSHYF